MTSVLANSADTTGDALPAGARLAEFEVRGVLGIGGFGIVYLAWDHALEREVALKEYMPAALAGRGRGAKVSVRSPSQRETYAIGLKSFVNEARLLARFDHPSLVKVYRFWEDHGTAYMVMPYYRGRTLRQVRQSMTAPPDEASCRRVLEPLLAALELLHAEDVFHRDIAPDNILVGDDGVPVLLDFGAARQVIGRTQSVTAILKPAFAPLEQYADMPSMRQGPWTDLYGLGATMSYLLTGQPPLPAAARALDDELPRLAAQCWNGHSKTFLEVLDWTLALRPPERPQSVSMLRDALDGRLPVPRARPRGTGVPALPAPKAILRRPARSLAFTGSFTVTDVDFEPTQPQRGRPPGRRLSLAGALGAAVALAVGAVAAVGLPDPAPRSVAMTPPPVAAVAETPPVTAAPASAAQARSLTAVLAPRQPGETRVHTPERPPQIVASGGPGERCADRNFVSRLVCMKQRCEEPALREHAECRRMRAEEQVQRERFQ